MRRTIHVDRGDTLTLTIYFSVMYITQHLKERPYEEVRSAMSCSFQGIMKGNHPCEGPKIQVVEVSIVRHFGSTFFYD